MVAATAVCKAMLTIRHRRQAQTPKRTALISVSKADIERLFARIAFTTAAVIADNKQHSTSQPDLKNSRVQLTKIRALDKQNLPPHLK